MASGFPGDKPTDTDPIGKRPSPLVDRIKRLLTAPKQEWARIDAEPATVRGIFTGWVVPLAAIGPIAGLIGGLLFGYGVFGIHFRPTVGGAVATAIGSYLLALAGTYGLALVIDLLAPNFGGVRNPVSAMKVAAYSATASWVAGAFQLLPPVAWLGLLGLYSLYLLWIGLPRLMRVPADRALGYYGVTLIAAIVIFAIVASVAGLVSRAATPAFLTNPDTVGGTVAVPGVGTVDLGKLDEASKRIEAANARIEAGSATPVKPVDAAALGALLPGSVGGFARTKVETNGASAAGIGGTQAQARYVSGDQSFSLSVTDAGQLGQFAALGGAIDLQHEKRTATGYERTSTASGALVTENWDTSAHSGSFQTMVASRFMVQAEGSAPNIDTLKAAVAAVDQGRLAALAR